MARRHHAAKVHKPKAHKAKKAAKVKYSTVAQIAAEANKYRGHAAKVKAVHKAKVATKKATTKKAVHKAVLQSHKPSSKAEHFTTV